MKEIVEGTSVYWTSMHETLASGSSSNGTQLALALTNIFFDKSTLSESNVKGGGSGKYVALNKKVLDCITGKIHSKYILCLL